MIWNDLPAPGAALPSVGKRTPLHLPVVIPVGIVFSVFKSSRSNISLFNALQGIFSQIQLVDAWMCNLKCDAGAAWPSSCRFHAGALSLLVGSLLCFLLDRNTVLTIGPGAVQISVVFSSVLTCLVFVICLYVNAGEGSTPRGKKQAQLQVHCNRGTIFHYQHWTLEHWSPFCFQKLFLSTQDVLYMKNTSKDTEVYCEHNIKTVCYWCNRVQVFTITTWQLMFSDKDKPVHDKTFIQTHKYHPY